MVVLDLFSGAGGLSLGFQNAGFCLAAGFDANPHCAESYAANFRAKALSLDLSDICASSIKDLVHNQLNIPRIDVLIGGPPCQGFAAVGQAKIRSLGREPDGVQYLEKVARRNHLYQEFVRFVEALNPQCFVMENVPHLASYEGGAVAAKICEDFDRLGYQIGTTDAPGAPIFLDAERYGVPQSRRRLFFIGFRRGLVNPVGSPVSTHSAHNVQGRKKLAQRSLDHLARHDDLNQPCSSLPLARTLADAISDLRKVGAPALDNVISYVPQERSDLKARGVLSDPGFAKLMREAMTGGQTAVLYDHVVRPVREDDRMAFGFMAEGGEYLDIPVEYRRYKASEDYFSDRYYRLPWGRPSRAITAHIAKDGYWYIHPDVDQERTLSVREAARIQSFPDHFRFAGHRTNMFTQIGNAVPPLLAQAVATTVRTALERGLSPRCESGYVKFGSITDLVGTNSTGPADIS